MYTRTTPRSSGGRAPEREIEEPAFRAVKVPSDPAQINVNHASFRVRLAPAPPSPRLPRSPVPPPAAGAAGLEGARRLPGPGGMRGTPPTGLVPSGLPPSGLPPPGPAVPGARPGADPSAEDTTPLPVVPSPGRPLPGGRPGGGVPPGGASRGARVLRTRGRDAPGASPVTRLLPTGSLVGTRLLPRVGERAEDATALVRPRAPAADVPPPRRHRLANPPEGDLLETGPPGSGLPDDEPEYDLPEYDLIAIGDEGRGGEGGAEGGRRGRGGVRAEPVPRAWHAHRRRSPGPGLVLLPLRIFLGGISVYAGMSKLCDPVYFDGGERGSMVHWLASLHPWAAAEPLRDFALSHPVGAGLTLAFLQIVVGVLSVLGLWQRAAAGVGMLLSAALLLTVAWRTVPVYDAPDIVYFAAWSPLLIAGAPSGSLDACLARDAWRRLGPRTSVYQLRRRVLRRGAVVATVVTGLTLLVGSLLGSAVRAGTFRTDLPEPSEPPVNHLPGSPLPPEPSPSPSGSASSTPREERAGSPSPSAATPSQTQPYSRPPLRQRPPTAASGATGGVTGGATRDGRPSQGGVTPPPQAPTPSPPPPPPPSPTTGGGTSGGGALGGILGGGLLGMEAGAKPASARSGGA